jgi:hypothetical protein
MVFALVGDADCEHVAGRRQAQGPRGDFLDAVADLDRVVLAPAGARVDLAVLAVGRGGWVAGEVEEDAAGAGRVLVDRGDVVGHRAGDPNCHLSR